MNEMTLYAKSLDCTPHSTYTYFNEQLIYGELDSIRAERKLIYLSPAVFDLDNTCEGNF